MSALCDPPGANSPPRPPLSAQELAQELKAFLSGVDPVHGTKLSAKAHARCALLLLRSLPPARHAALHHLRSVFDEQVSSYLVERESAAAGGVSAPTSNRGGTAGGLEEVVREVQGVLAEFVGANPKAWAPVVSAWSIELMGQLSSKYAGRHGVPHAASSLNQLLQLWMACAATRALMDIYSQCLAAMIGGCPDACVDALLDTSVQHSPHFDWVVAHIGSSFPSTIISRVLSCGLKDFCAHGGGAGGADSLAVNTDARRTPKIASVVGILGHLASRHAGSIKQEILRMFHESLGPARDPPQQAAVPFLLQLAVMSPALLGAVSSELVDSLQPSVLNRLQQHLAPLPRQDLDDMAGVVVRLLCQSSAGAFRALQFLVATAMPASVITPPGPTLHDGVREACDRIVHLLLLRLQKLVYERPCPSLSDSAPRPVPFLEALRPHLRDLCLETLRLERKRFLWQHRLLGLLALYSAPHGASEALFHLLALARGPEQLGLATQLYAVLASGLRDLLPATVATCVAQIHAGRLPDAQLAQLLRNLAAVVQGEGGEGAAAMMGAQLGAALAGHLHDLARLLLHRQPEAAEAACALLSACPLPRSLPPAHLFAAVRAAVHHFFWVLRHHRRRRHREMADLGASSRLLVRLSAVSPAAAKAVLQQLVEGALCGSNAELFGAVPEHSGREESVATENGVSVSLLDVNRRFTSAVSFSGGGVWSVFHAGVIGQGLKAPPEASEKRESEEVARNSQAFLTLLLRCCRGIARGGDSAPDSPAGVVHPEAAKAVAAALVESVCPEAGGELAWPPEEQARGTVERDLRICRRFRRHPLLFPLLGLVAAGRPALCYCSVLLRGLLASLMAFWDASRESRTSASPWHLRASCALVACMAEGSLLPPLLGNVHELFPRLAPFEVHLLLLSAWDYLRENSPLPQKFTFQPDRGVFLRDFSRDGDLGKHLAVLHSVLHNNIQHLGLLAARFRP